MARGQNFLPGSLKRRKSVQIFPEFSCKTHLKLLGGIIRTIFLCRKHHFFSGAKHCKNTFSICFPLAAFVLRTIENSDAANKKHQRMN